MDHIKTDPITGEKRCSCFKRCGGCQLDESYEKQLTRKQEKAEHLFGELCTVSPIIPMDRPYNYRSKVQTVYGTDRSGRIISGVYQSSSGRLVATDDCMLEDKRAHRVVKELKKLMKSMRITPYSPSRGIGVLKHTLIRTSPSTGQVMVVLVTSGAMLPAKHELVKALTKACPFITTIVHNISPDGLPLTLGERQTVLYGPGYIEDRLCGCTFRISPGSFYQVNPAQTEKLYSLAVEAADITPDTRLMDAYCGTGTIGIICASKGAQVIGVESNASAVNDAKLNAKANGLENIRFVNLDAGEYIQALAKAGESCDTVILDPPRAGASQEFIKALGKLSPERIVYVSCKPETLRRDLNQLIKLGYEVTSVQPVDMFPHTISLETVAALRKRKAAAPKLTPMRAAREINKRREDHDTRGAEGSKRKPAEAGRQYRKGHHR